MTAAARSLGLAVAAVMSLCALAPAASARRVPVPYHELGPIECLDGGIMRAYPPRLMRPAVGGNEQVEWSPDLYKWNRKRRSWRRFDGSRPWYVAITGPYGYYQASYDQAWHTPGGMGMLFVPFSGLRPGRYAVKNFMYWNRTGAKRAKFGPVCAFR
jgi:hypothetical protein